MHTSYLLPGRLTGQGDHIGELYPPADWLNWIRFIRSMRNISGKRQKSCVRLRKWISWGSVNEYLDDVNERDHDGTASYTEQES